jgi:hypothetical protein
VNGMTVVWSRENIVQKCFSFHSLEGQEIVQVLWAWFTLDNISGETEQQQQQQQQRDFRNEHSKDHVDLFSNPFIKNNNIYNQRLDALFESNSQHGKQPDESSSGFFSKPPQKSCLSEPKRALVIVFSNLLKIYFDEGYTYSAPLPFLVKQVWPLDRGILIQCDLEAFSDLPADRVKNLPILYSLRLCFLYTTCFHYI